MPPVADAVADNATAASGKDFDLDATAFGLNADGSDPGDNTSTPIQATPQAADASPSPVADAAPVAPVAEPTVADPAAQQQAADAAQVQTNHLLELAKTQFGYQGQHPNDMAFLQHLMRTQEEYARSQADLNQFRQVQPYLSEFGQYMQQRQQAAQQQAQVDPWGRPEFDPAWEQLLENDEAGGVRLRKGVIADPSIPAKYAAYVQHQRNFIQNLTRDPEKTLAPLMQSVAQQVYQGLQQEFAQRDQQARAAQIVQQNASWLKGPNGQLTPKGQRYAQLVEGYHQRGIVDEGAQHHFAMLQLERDELLAQVAQQKQAPTLAQNNQAAQQQFLQQTNGSVRRPSSAGAGAGPAAGPMSLADMVRQATDGQSVEFDKPIG